MFCLCIHTCTKFPVNTIVEWILNIYHDIRKYKITTLLLPLEHISFRSYVFQQMGSLENWYVSVVSIILDSYMPILYKFHIFLATFYMIYWTNILIQCPAPVPVFCMFFVLQNIHIKRSPSAIKIYGELFWNICDFWEVESTQTKAHGLQKTLGRGLPPGVWWCLVGTP